MPEWAWWVMAYLAAGMLLGELYLYACKLKKLSCNKIGYVLGSSIWPITFTLIVILGYRAWKKGK